jgi:hypothetical protein
MTSVKCWQKRLASSVKTECAVEGQTDRNNLSAGMLLAGL